MCVRARARVQHVFGAHVDPQRVPVPMELELQIVAAVMWVLGVEPRPSSHTQKALLTS